MFGWLCSHCKCSPIRVECLHTLIAHLRTSFVSNGHYRPTNQICSRAWELSRQRYRSCRVTSHLATGSELCNIDRLIHGNHDYWPLLHWQRLSASGNTVSSSTHWCQEPGSPSLGLGCPGGRGWCKACECRVRAFIGCFVWQQYSSAKRALSWPSLSSSKPIPIVWRKQVLGISLTLWKM